MVRECAQYLNIDLSIFIRKIYRLKLKLTNYSNQGIVKKATNQTQTRRTTVKKKKKKGWELLKQKAVKQNKWLFLKHINKTKLWQVWQKEKE